VQRWKFPWVALVGTTRVVADPGAASCGTPCAVWSYLCASGHALGLEATFLRRFSLIDREGHLNGVVREEEDLGDSAPFGSHPSWCTWRSFHLRISNSERLPFCLSIGESWAFFLEGMQFLVHEELTCY
jgi:hypothetical protein